jgi:hypothetical protein
MIELSPLDLGMRPLGVGNLVLGNWEKTVSPQINADGRRSRQGLGMIELSPLDLGMKALGRLRELGEANGERRIART